MQWLWLLGFHVNLSNAIYCVSFASLYLPDHKSVFLTHILPAHDILSDVERPKCPCSLAQNRYRIIYS